jgi:nucleotide-binding universal stress UspA family protein
MYKRILAPLDSSELAECTLQHVKTIACGCQVPEVVLLQVAESIPRVYMMDEAWHRDTDAKALEEAKKYVAKVADDLKDDLNKHGVAVKTAVVPGRADEVILDYTSENQVDLIIMSTHGRSGVSRWIFGSVADRVVHHATVPVLIVTPTGCKIS